MTVIVRDASSGRWRVFDRPSEVIVATQVDEVLPALRRVERECAGRQRYASGFLSYEAAPAFDAALKTRPPDGFPLLWFGLYDGVHERSLEELGPAGPLHDEQWNASVSGQRYREVFAGLQELIRDGETYQVNYTYRLRTRLRSDPFAVFLQLADAQRPPFAAYVDTGDWVVCSASPELFFHRAGTRIESRPMKGTARRGLWFEQDLEQARRLGESEKQRAENVMIVDMVRNDLGRVARPGTVRATHLFDVERYPTVLQLTSTVSAETDATLVGVMSALFPAASITGAPKPRTMDIIAGVECSPRRIYTGAIGFVDPGGRAQFSVAIRTMLVNAATRDAEFGVGGGIVADSDPDDEWKESTIKSRVLAAAPPSFDLLETLLWTPDGGFLLMGRHLKRLLQSADYFGFQVDVLDVRDRLERHAAGLPRAPHRVRLLASRHGAVAITAKPQDAGQGFDEVTLAAAPVDRDNPFLYHKTTNRTVYEAAVRSRPGFSDVILFNDAGEVTESTVANLAVSIGGELLTPPVECGLLPGTLRAHLLEERRLRERRVTIDEMSRASACYLFNSVRGFHPVTVRYKSVSDGPAL